MQDRQEVPVPAELVSVQPTDGGGPVLVPRASMLPGLAPHEQRMVQEAMQLSENISELRKRQHDTFGEISVEDSNIMSNQIEAMKLYESLLHERIQRLKPAVETTSMAAHGPTVEMLVVWNQASTRWEILVTNKTQAKPSETGLKLMFFDLKGEPTAAGLGPAVGEIVQAMRSVTGAKGGGA